jgi:hypothetical protein
VDLFDPPVRERRSDEPDDLPVAEVVVPVEESDRISTDVLASVERSVDLLERGSRSVRYDDRLPETRISTPRG